MTVKTTLSFTDRHHAFLQRQVGEGVFATTSSAVAVAVERLMADEVEQKAMIDAMADEIRERLKTPIEEYLSAEKVFAELYAGLDRRV
jgi:antitoxin ParD1/3/4